MARFNRKIRSALIVVVLTTAACQAQRTPWEDAWAEAAAVQSGCYQRFKSGEFKKLLAVADCSESRVRQTFAQSGFPHMDVINLILATRRAGARKFDQGTLTLDELDLAMTEMDFRANSELARRDSMHNQTESQRLIAWSTFIQTLPRTFTCSGGPVITCY